jgi:hypothetical protein
MPTPRCGDLLRLRVTLNPSQVIQRSNLSTIVFFLISSFPFERNLHKLESLTPYTNDLDQNTRVRGVATHRRAQIAAIHAHESRREHKEQHNEVTA